MYDAERDRLTRIAAECSKAGVREQEIYVQQRQGALFAAALDVACRAVEMPAPKRQALHAEVVKALEITPTPQLEHLFSVEVEDDD